MTKSLNNLKHRRLTDNNLFVFESVTGFNLALSLIREQKTVQKEIDKRLRVASRKYKQQLKTLDFTPTLF